MKTVLNVDQTGDWVPTDRLLVTTTRKCPQCHNKARPREERDSRLDLLTRTEGSRREGDDTADVIITGVVISTDHHHDNHQDMSPW